MGGLFSIIGRIAVGVVLLGAAGIGYAFYEAGRLDAQATEYSEDAVAAITANWNGGALRTRAAPQLAASMTQEQTARLFAWLASLGPLQDRPVCQGSASVHAGSGGSRTSATILCNAHYRAGPATVSLALIRVGGVWSILGFHVSSPMLLPQAPSQKT